MKKLFTLFGLALAMLTVGCTTGLNEEATITNKVEIGVTIDEATRIEMIGVSGTTIKLGWSEGDVIYVNGVKSEPLAASYVGKAEAKFFVSGAVVAPYNVVYAPQLVVDTDGEIILPEVRECTTSELGAVFVGQSATEAVSLSAASGFIAMGVTGVPTETCNISVKAAAGEILSGNAVYDFESGEMEMVGGLPTVSFSNVPVVAGLAEVVVPVPTGAYANGFVVSVIAGDTEMVKTSGATAGTNIAAGKVVVMPELAYAGTPRALSIKSAADLQAFLTAVDAGDYAAYVNGVGEVLIENDIDLTGVTLNGSLLTGETAFSHTLNGQGHALKNWNVTSALFADNRGTIKNLVLDASCTWTPIFNGDQAMVVLKNNGVVSGITSNVNIELNMFDTEATTTLGAIVARTYTPVLNCVNNGNMTFTNVYWNTGNIYLGGVVGYGWYQKGKMLVANCENNGDIKIVCADGIVGKNAYIGGVFGSTSQAGYTTLTSHDQSYGTIYNCVNNGDVYVERKALDSGSYANIAGVVGYAEADVLNCVNKGAVSYICPNNHAESATASTRPCVGGVVGVCTYYLGYCVNEGTVTMEGTYAAGGTSGTTSGIGASGNPCFGGVAGQVGNHAVATAISEFCVNNGPVVFNSTMRPANGTAAQIGAVFGLSNNSVLNCVNNADFTISECFATTYAAGVVGRLYYNPSFVVEDCVNNGNITYNWVESSKASQIYFGGIVGHGKNCGIADCTNNGDLTFGNTHYATANSYLGGIVGQYDGGSCTITNSKNYGDLSMAASTKWRAGGIAGCAGGNIDGCVNQGNVSTPNNTSGVVGGINGFGQANIANSEATCSLTSSATSPAGGLVGGHGNTAQNWDGNTVKVVIVAEGAYCGILCGDNTASSEGKISTIGGTATNYVLEGTTINGVAVTAADCADLTKLYGHIATDGFGILAEGGATFVPAN